MRSLLLLSAAMLLLGACARYEWVKPGGDPSTYGADHYNCLQNAAANAPPLYQTHESGSYDREVEQVRKRCERSVFTNKKDCYMEITREHPDPPRLVTTDLNEAHRNELYNACMGSRGWVKQRVEAKE